MEEEVCYFRGKTSNCAELIFCHDFSQTGAVGRSPEYRQATAQLKHTAAAQDVLPSETGLRPGSPLFHATDYEPDSHFCCPLPTATSQAGNSKLRDKKHFC